MSGIAPPFMHKNCNPSPFLLTTQHNIPVCLNNPEARYRATVVCAVHVQPWSIKHKILLSWYSFWVQISAHNSFHWLSISYHIQYKTHLLTYTALHGYTPGYLTELLLPYTPTCVLRSSGSSLLTIPRFGPSSMGGRSFSVGSHKFPRAFKKSPLFPASKHNSKSLHLLLPLRL